MTIRSLKAGDIDSVVAMAFTEGWITDAREFETHRRLRGALGVVLTEGNEVIGCVTVFTHRRSAWIGNLLVRPDRRRQGLGVRLIKHALGWTEDRSVETVLLAADARAVSLYRRMGFKPLIPIYRWRREGKWSKSSRAGQNWRRRSKAPDARQTNVEARERMYDYVTEPRRRITPQTGFSIALLGDKHSLRRIAVMDAACWDDDRSKLLKLIRLERACVVFPDDAGFLMYGRLGEFLTLGPGAVTAFDKGQVEYLIDRALSRIGGEHPLVLDAFPANKRLSKVLDAVGFAVVSSTLLMYKGRRPDINFKNILATATLGSMG